LLCDIVHKKMLISPLILLMLPLVRRHLIRLQRSFAISMFIFSHASAIMLCRH
jgi:hypothetical protein